jgi:glyoxylase-like metal-dependent hydrolase (beta-lactamase superfamily II)
VQQLGSTMRIFRPAPGVTAFYDGRIEGMRLHSDKRNWLDDGAFALGVCTYAVVDGEDALVYDTHISLQHARIVRRTLAEAGVRRIRVVLSHWHVDHVAGNQVFADCEIVAHRLTAEAMRAHRAELEDGDPPIRPLVLPTLTYEGNLDLLVGRVAVELRHADVHSLDGTVLLLPEQKLMFAGDTLEDPVTYVVEPDRLAVHLRDLERMAGWDLARILPNHGALEIIGAGGYDPALVDATRGYVEKLLQLRAEPALADEDLATFCRPWFDKGAIHYFTAYEAVHRRNVEAVRRGEF